jgi:hypothetical protein
MFTEQIPVGMDGTSVTRPGVFVSRSIIGAAFATVPALASPAIPAI